MEEEYARNQDAGAVSAEGFAGQISGETVHFNDGFAGMVSANQDMVLTDGGAFGIGVGRDMQLSDGGAFAMAVGHDMEVMNGGALVLAVGGGLDVTNGGSVVTIANQVSAANSFFGVLISGSTTLEEGSRVLLDTKQVLALGAAFGSVFALLSWLLRRR